MMKNLDLATFNNAAISLELCPVLSFSYLAYGLKSLALKISRNPAHQYFNEQFKKEPKDSKYLTKILESAAEPQPIHPIWRDVYYNKRERTPFNKKPKIGALFIKFLCSLISIGTKKRATKLTLKSKKMKYLFEMLRKLSDPNSTLYKFALQEFDYYYPNIVREMLRPKRCKL